MPGDRALSARLRCNALPRLRHAALGPAGGARQRPQGAHGRARARARRARRLRLGRARRYYFHTERGRAGLEANRREFCRFIWQLWSPNWRFDDATYDRTAASFDNPDFVDVVIHSYRHRFGYAGGDPSLEAIEQRLAAKPRISVPTIVLHGDGSGLSPPESSLKHAASFTGPYQRRVIPTAGHNLPQEASNASADAVLELVRATK